MSVNISAKEVNELRQKTGSGMMDCKKALVEAGGDFDKAIDILRKKGQKVADETGKEVMSRDIWKVFEKNYIAVEGKLELMNYALSSTEDSKGNTSDQVEITLRDQKDEVTLSGVGGGPIEAFVSAVNNHFSTSITVSDYHQHSVTSGADAKAAAYIELTQEGQNEWGAGIDGNTVKASFQAIVAGLNKLII